MAQRGAGSIETIQARVLPTEALEIVPDEEAAQYIGSYIKWSTLSALLSAIASTGERGAARVSQ